jgi:hypothetical protein
VQTAVNTLNEVDEFRNTRKLPTDAVTSAALPGDASAPPTGTETVRPEAEPLNTGKA